jgi:alkanesulfonate monooxygenase SsuD/methylene tetrahydromethanopterin reductase-like flavin-dependent oxidoreductase (luciferase family)
VKFSYFMPTMMEGRFAKMGTITWDSMLERARAAEDLGCDGIWLGEFIETQKDVATGFPGEHPHNYAPLTTMTALAMATSTVRFTTAVIVLPYHDPLILGREVATLDNITNGRITLGVGLGGEAEDFRRTRQQLGAVNRSRMMDECLEAMRTL